MSMQSFLWLTQYDLPDRILFSGFKILLILFCVLVFGQIINKAVVKILKRTFQVRSYIKKEEKEISKREEKTILKLFSSLLNSIIWISVLLMILPEFGVDTKALLAGVGVFGLAIGMGTRQVVQDYVSGIFIVLENQYRVGDEVEISGKKGRVVDMSLRRTILKDAEGVIHFISHSQIKITSRKIEKNG